MESAHGNDAMEVTFDGGTVHRRKASIENGHGTGKSSRPGSSRRSTECIVHTLLAKHDGIRVEDHALSHEGLAQERRVDKDPHSNAGHTQHSRLLTKTQISDMAFGIRELSKKLSQIRLKLHVKNIFILGKAHDETLIKHSRDVADWLLTKDAQYKV
jgi:NAD+ kinase